MHRIDTVFQIVKYIEFITLNLASFGWILIDINTIEIAETVEQFNSPNWLTVLIGISIAFFNVARGIKAIRESKKK